MTKKKRTGRSSPPPLLLLLPEVGEWPMKDDADATTHWRICDSGKSTDGTGARLISTSNE